MIGHAGILIMPLLAGAADTAPSFNRDVLPILSNNCFLCHGPDKGTRQANMRLDIPEGARLKGLIVPDDKGTSDFLLRITADNPAHRMPPMETGKALTESQLRTLHQWAHAGAPYEPHWAFVAPVPVDPPPRTHWGINAIDAFIHERLQLEGLSPNDAADRATLIRRVSLDLTGLPPSPEAVHAFLGDTREDAYERVVDALLASEHFGEHQARPWLDLARYADSQGFEKDNLRTMWRYRDWVIDAFNSDMPFDQFTLEQLAGDLLPNATREHHIATGFHRNTQTNTEGGTDNEEFRSGAVIDRVNTTMEGWMGLSAGCAQCHDHKFDPLSQQAYFELYAFFNQTADADLDNDAPFIKAPTSSQQATLTSLKSDQVAFNTQLGTPNEARIELLNAWLDTRCLPSHWHTQHPLANGAANGTQYDVAADGTITASGPNPSTERTSLEVRSTLPRITGIRLSALADGGGPGRAENTNFVLTDISVSTRNTQTQHRFAHAQASFNQSDFPVAQAIDAHDNADSGWAIGGGADHDQHAVFTFDDPLIVPDDGLITLHLSQQYNTHGLGRFRIAITDHATPSLALAETATAASKVPRDDRTPLHWTTLTREAMHTAESLQSLRNEEAALESAINDVQTTIPTTLVMKRLTDDTLRTTKLFLGGTFLAPDHDRGPLEPAVPDMLHPLGASTATRIDLARWLVAHDNPLTSRVQVNRAWARLFGSGLVNSLDNFGVQGKRPSHPALLDWLALHWQTNLHWSSKALLKLLVMSSTYRQDAAIDADALAKDPNNRLLSRASRIRLSAEQLRDTALSAAGLLKTDRIGGPSVVPRLPEGMLPQAFTTFVQQASTGDDLYRRGLYTQWRRTGHYPTFATFDAPSRELCVVARERSNTPLQALAMLNDAVFVEAAQGLARRSMASDDPIGRAFECALARKPTAQERAILQSVHDEALSRAKSKGTLALATDPIGPLPEGVDPQEAVAMTVTCNVLLNLDEFVNRP